MFMMEGPYLGPRGRRSWTVLSIRRTLSISDSLLEPGAAERHKMLLGLLVNKEEAKDNQPLDVSPRSPRKV
jgi:hypothetical protein